MRTRAAIVAACGLLAAGCSSPAVTAGSTVPAATTTIAATTTAATTTATAAPAGQVRLLDPADFQAQSAGRVLINVHIPDEGSLPGTTQSLPYNEVTARAAELPADRSTPLAIYCMSGSMSAIAGQELLDLGYTDVIELDGGMRAWQASGRSLS